MKVLSIKPEETYQWCLKKHYAHRIPPIGSAFGIYNDMSILVGICTYATPMSWSLQIGICGENYANRVIELNRLCLNEGLPKNTASYFISQTFKLLPKPAIVVSYSDTAQNHHGYIYQACNFIYTGLSKPFKEYAVRGLEHMHSASIGDTIGRSDKIGHGKSKYKMLEDKYGKENVYWRERSLKHRYLYFLGSKKQIKEYKKALLYKIEPYPKGDNKRYDTSFQPETQELLF